MVAEIPASHAKLGDGFPRHGASEVEDLRSFMKAPINRWLHATRRIWTATFAAAAVLTLGTPAAAQDAPKPLEPEYANSLFLLDSSGSLKPLERQPVGVGGKGRVLGFGAMGVSYEIQNEHSPIRVASSAPLEIVVKLEDRDVDTATPVLLYPLRIAKRKRQILISGAGFMAIHTKSDLQSTQLQMVFAKYGQASLKITPESPLAPGEYAIAVQTRDEQPTAYCFGIDTATR
jgi:hypothetical protein